MDVRRKVLGPEHPETLWSMNGLASSYYRLGRSKEAARLYEEPLVIRRKVLGPEHPDTLLSMNGLASSFDRLGQSKEAAQLHEETLAIQRKPEHPDTLRSMNILTSSSRNQGRWDEAVALEETIKGCEKVRKFTNFPLYESRISGLTFSHPLITRTTIPTHLIYFCVPWI